jgi:hypothetical protein
MTFPVKIYSKKNNSDFMLVIYLQHFNLIHLDGSIHS